MSTSWDHMLCDIFFVSWSSTQPCSTLFWRSNAKATFQKTTHVWCFVNPSTVVYTLFLIQSHLYHHPEWSSGRRIQHHDLILECLVSLRDWDLCTLAMHRSFFEKNADVLGKHPKKHKWSHARCDSHDAMCYSPIQHAPRQSNSHDIKIPPARDPIWRDVIKLPWTSTLPWFLRVVNLLAFPCCISLLLEWRSSWWWLDLAKIHQSHVLW